MKKHLPILFFVCALLTLTIGFNPLFVSKTTPEKVKQEQFDGDNANARWEHELILLADPKTGKIPDNIRLKELAFAATLPDYSNQTSKVSALAAPTFTSRGPWNQGGRTRALAVDVSNSNIYVAGGVSGGMWRSTNAGATWTKTTTLDQLQSASCVAQDKRSGKRNIWYYGTGERLGNSASATGAPYRGNGIYKSVDSAKTWAVLTSTVSINPTTFNNNFQYCYNVATNPANAGQDEVLAAVEQNIMRSIDGGLDWTSVLGGALFGNYSDITITSTGVYYAAFGSLTTGGSALYRSTNGVNWTNITPAGFPTNAERVVIAVAPSNENIVYFLADVPAPDPNDPNVPSFWKYKYLGGDGSGLTGGKWEDRSFFMPISSDFTGTYAAAVGGYNSQGSYNLVCKVNPADTNLVFIGATNLYRSTDGWSLRLNNNGWVGGYDPEDFFWQNQHPDQHALVYINDSIALTAHDGGVSRFNVKAPVGDANQRRAMHTNLNNGYITSQFYSVAIDPVSSGNEVVIGGLQDNSMKLVFGAGATTPWIEWPHGGDGAFCAIANNREFYIMSSQTGGFRRLVYDNVGNVLTTLSIRPTGTSSSNYNFIAPFAMDPNSSNLLYIPYNQLSSGVPVSSRIAFNPNVTATSVSAWTQYSQNTTSGVISAISVSTSNPANRLYYGTRTGKVYRLENANSGSTTNTHIEITGANFPANANVNCIAVDPDDGNVAYVVFSNYNIESIYETRNGGVSWTPVSGNLETNLVPNFQGPSVRWMTIARGNDGFKRFFVGTSIGLFMTDLINGVNTTWVQVGANVIGNIPVMQMAFRQVDQRLVVATHGAGVFQAEIPNFPNSNEPIVSSARAELQVKNFPNPFIGQTKILYRVPQRDVVKLHIYSSTGQFITTLDEGTKEEGLHEREWQAAGLKSGTYICRLELGKGGTGSTRLILVQ